MKSLLSVALLASCLTLNGCCTLGMIFPLTPSGSSAVSAAPAKAPKASAKTSEKASEKKELAAIAETTSSGNTVKVNLSGDFTFKKNSSELSAAAVSKIKSIADVLKKDPSNKVTVVGYTDNSGTPEGNQKLSERRAKAVMKELVKDGIPEANVKSEGKGQKDPVASNDTEEGRAKNRRTELRIVNK